MSRRNKIDSEQLLISAVLRTGDITPALEAGIGPDMFFQYREAWAWLDGHYQEHGVTPSKVSFKQRFPKLQLLATDDVAQHTQDVRRDYISNATTQLLSDIADDLTAMRDPWEVLESLQVGATGIAVNAHSEPGVNILADWEGVYEQVEIRAARVEEHGSAGWPTGWPTLDRATGGPQPGQLWIIGARLGHGKTWVLVKTAVQAVMAGAKVHVESLEQPRNQMAQRIQTVLAHELTVASGAKGGKLPFRASALNRGVGIDLPRYKRFLADLESQVPGSMTVTDATRGKATVMTLASHIERHKPDLVVVDYLTLLRTPDREWRSMAQFSAEMKGLASRYGVAIVCAAQLNREAGIGKELPGPEALAQSDSFGQDADCVITMRKHPTGAVIDMRLSKYRHGADGQGWSVQFDPDQGALPEVTPERRQALVDAHVEED